MGGERPPLATSQVRHARCFGNKRYRRAPCRSAVLFDLAPGVMATALSKIEQAKAERCGLDLAPELAELAAQGWDNLDEADLTIRLKWLGIFFRPVTPGRFMVRLRLPNGVIRADQLEVLADAADCSFKGPW